MADGGRGSDEKERPPNYITLTGYRKLVEEYNHLRTVERPKVVRGVTEAAAEGDRSENAEYIYGKRRLHQIDRRMKYLSERIGSAEVVDPREHRGASDRVFFGATVILEDEQGEREQYQLVGEDEIDATERRISWRSPVGQRLIGRALDDEVRVTTPSGLRVFTITEVRYG